MENLLTTIMRSQYNYAPAHGLVYLAKDKLHGMNHDELGEEIITPCMINNKVAKLHYA